MPSTPAIPPRRGAGLGTIAPRQPRIPSPLQAGVGAYVRTESMFEMVMTMTTSDEQAAVLALTRVTHTRPWFHTARAILDAGSALELLDGRSAGRDADDRAYAADLAARVRPGDLTWARDLVAAMRGDGVRLVTVLDAAYPANLMWAYDRQPFLWVRGDLRPGEHRSVAVIGEDDPGHAAAAARALAQADITVVAPLRSAVDAAVHQAAHDAGGRSLAVLAGGLAEPGALGEYTSVAEWIAERGAVVSAFWPHAVPTGRTAALVPVVTCGLADCLYVVDGAESGTSAAHVRQALETGTHVFASQRLHREHPWVARAGARGGMTAVQDTDDLPKLMVNLVDMTPGRSIC
jgi:DNA processing protein